MVSCSKESDSGDSGMKGRLESNGGYWCNLATISKSEVPVVYRFQNGVYYSDYHLAEKGVAPKWYKGFDKEKKILKLAKGTTLEFFFNLEANYDIKNGRLWLADIEGSTLTFLSDDKIVLDAESTRSATMERYTIEWVE